MEERLNTYYAKTTTEERVYEFVMGGLIAKSADDTVIPEAAYGILFSKLFYKFEDFGAMINRLRAEFPDRVEQIAFLDSISDLVVTSASKILNDIVVPHENPAISTEEVQTLITAHVAASEDLKEAVSLVSEVPEILSCNLEEIKDRVDAILESEKGRIEGANDASRDALLTIEGEDDNEEDVVAVASSLEIYRTPLYTEVVENPVDSIYNRLTPALLNSEVIQAKLETMNREELTDLIKNSLQTTIKVVLTCIQFCNILNIPNPGLNDMCNKLTDAI